MTQTVFTNVSVKSGNTDKQNEKLNNTNKTTHVVETVPERIN